MRTTPSESQAKLTRVGSGRLLIVVLALVVLVAIWGIFSGYGDARRAAIKELELQTAAHARALEAQLANLRADLLFLSQSPPLLRFPTVWAQDDPVVARWGRLDAEGTLLLFLGANPAVERLSVTRDQEQVILAGRRRGTPILLPTDASLPSASGMTLRGEWLLGSARQELWRLTADVAPMALLDLTAPGFEERLQLVDGSSEMIAMEGEWAVRSSVELSAWRRADDLFLERREERRRVMGSVESLARHYRTTIGIHVVLAILATILAAMAFEQVRRVARLEVQNAQQAQIRELENQLLHSERLASVGRLAAGMAHEINNPLAGMANYLSLLNEDLEAGHLEEAPEWIAKLREGLERAAGITHQALRLSKPGSGVREQVAIAELIARTVDFLRGNPAYRGIEFHWRPPKMSPVLAGDPITLGQLFLNLMLNACQDQSTGGEVDISLEETADEVTVSIADRGPGLTIEAEERLFEPFYSSRGSTGLGLAICRRIVEDHQGEISAQNRQGGGAVFYVRLPHGPLTSPGEDEP